MFDFFKRKKAAAVYEPAITFKSRAQQFWEWFESRADDLDAMHDGTPIGPEVIEEVATNASRVVDGMAWCFGPAMDKSGHHLALSPEGDPYSLLLTIAWVKLAPDLPRWEFYPAKPGGASSGQSIRIGEHDLPFDGLQIALTPYEDHQVPALTAWHDVFEDCPENVRIQVLFIILDEVLGELGTGAWLGPIEAADGPLPASFPVTELNERLDQFYDVMEWQKPSPTETWSGLKLNSPDAELPFPQADSLTKTTCIVRLVQDYFHSPDDFEDPTLASGAALAYVQLPTAFLPQGNEAFARGDIEDAITEAIEPDSLGCIIGGGLGLVYSYIDILLLDGSRSVDAILAVLRERQLPDDTELRFYDHTMRDVVYPV